MTINQFSKQVLFPCFYFLSTILLFSQTRYIDDFFTNINETKNVTFSTNVPQPLPSNRINLFFASVPANSNVPEHRTQNRNLRMDIFEPQGDLNTSRPVIIFCFGGGFTQGNKNAADMRALATQMAKKGFVTASMEYRLGINLFDAGASQRAVYRGIQDSRAAIRYFRNDAATNNTYKINSNKIYIAGFSAGGLIALHNVYLDKENERPNSTRATRYRYSNNSIFGFSNFNIPDLGCLDCSGDNQNLSGKANAAIAFAGAIGDLSYVEGNSDVPVLLFHSSNDNTVPFNSGVPYGAGRTQLAEVFGSNTINNRALAIGAPTRFETYTNRNHSVHTQGGSNLYPDIIPKIARFLLPLVTGNTDTPIPTSPISTPVVTPEPTPTPPSTSEIPLGQIISLRKKGGDRKYVTAERFADNNQLLARGGSVLAWEKFEVEPHPQGGIALKALSNGRYIQVNANNQNVPIRARGNQKREWEQFNWLNVNPGEVALQSMQSGRWIQAAWPTNNAILYPRGASPREWETFEWKIERSNKRLNSSENLGLEVFPNPIHKGGELNININLEETENVLVQLLDTAGKELFAKNFTNVPNGGATIVIKSTRIGIASGLYIVKTTTQKSSSTRKVVFN